MKVIKPQKLSLLTRCFESKRRFFLGVAVLSLHHFSRAMASEAAMWQFLAEELGKEGVPDTGMPKLRGEFLMTGRAYQEGGEARPTSEVRVRIGDLDKTLVVFGDRDWQNGGPSEPQPFVEMPISWERAFGGEGFEQNPLGKGVAPIETQDGEIHPLPNVELPTQPVTSERDRPSPAGFGPIELMWPQRLGKVGTYDSQWLAQRFPGFADDLDWSIFNVASEDQQQPEPFVGDEEFAVEGMHPMEPRLAGQLPSAAARCFVNQRAAGDEELHEVNMQLTTVWLFPHVKRYLLVFHGTHEVAEDDAADVLDLMIATEDLDQPKDAEHYKRVRELRLDPEKGAIHTLRDSDLLPSDPAILAKEDGRQAGVVSLTETEGLLRRNQRRKAERELEERRAGVAAMGLDPDVYVPDLPPEEEPPSMDELPELMEKMQADAERQKKEAEQRQAQMEEELRERLTAQGLDADEMIDRAKQKPSGPPQFSAEQEIEKLSTMAAQYAAMGYSAEMLEGFSIDAERRQMLEEAEEKLRENYRLAAQHQGPATRFDGEQAAQSRAAVMATLQQGKSLARLNLTGFDLSGLDLHGVDLSGAWLENANLTGANLQGANLSKTVLARANLTDTDLTNANLSKANLALAELTRTRADGANLCDAILERARCDGASFWSAKLDRANLNEATFAATDMSEASLPQINFLKTDLTGVCFAGADLGKCNFIECDVSGVDFRRCSMEKVSFVQTIGDGVIFRGARLTSAVFVHECSFEKADFREATIELANLRLLPLAESDFTDARVTGSDFSESDLTKAKLERASARDALFAKTCLSEATLVGANLMEAILQNADLRGADLRGANLYAADLARIRTDEHTRLDRANTNKARTVPTRESEVV